MKNHFIFGYTGNKRDEVEKIYDSINFDGVNTIIEPYCGTSAISYYISLKQPKKFKYILNDNNKLLIEMYNILRNEDKRNNLVNDLNLIHSFVFSGNTPEERKKNYNELKKNDSVESYIYLNKIYCIRAGLYPICKEERYKKLNFDYIHKLPILTFLMNEDIIFLCNNAVDIIETYKHNKDCLLILDPPYFSTTNTLYRNPDLNIYEYLCNNEINMFDCKITLILENIWVIKLLFNKYNCISYDKTYARSLKKTSHAIYSNY